MLHLACMHVIAVFLLPAYLSWLAAILLYTGGLIEEDLLNKFDTLFLHIKPLKNSKWNHEVHKATLILSAQQMVTGIGILAASFATLSTTLVADYHTAIYLAWMSSNGFLATLTLQRHYLQKNTYIRAVKLFAMLIFLAMMCAAIFPTTNFEWADHILIQPACSSASSCVALTTYVPSLWHSASNTNLNGMLSPQGVISYILLITSYTWQATMLFEYTNKRTHYIIRTPLRLLGRAVLKKALQRLEPLHPRLYDFRYRLLLGIYLFFIACLDFAGSFACFLSLVTVSFAWANFELLIPRLHVFPSCVRHALDKWDFGQILPLLLLLGPFYNFVEHRLRDRNSENDISTSGPEDSSNQGKPPINPVSSVPLSTIFMQCEPAGGTTEDTAQALLDLEAAIQREVYSITYFKVLLGLLSTFAVGVSVGYFVETILAYTGPSEPYTWYTRSWHILPDVVGGAAAFIGIFLVALLGPFLSHHLSA
ncbi:uncharacterized protein N7483_007926 [Penicillium malachiteum]|uniref:uncharacterized protein n=1 Tax=Penicillium malachiteum TaxID=1324776 RepID=UPI002548C771|nr:uncharacterized protein N7483_007926 [Penicillium malachiteum]KAJ5726569.1 hypothetical protein N7483_007926 [Penicillium malachiteum]